MGLSDLLLATGEGGLASVEHSPVNEPLLTVVPGSPELRPYEFAVSSLRVFVTHNQLVGPLDLAARK